jgi:hypothetical protein
VTYRNAISIDTLGAEVDEMAPNRSKVSDGTIGDDDHATRDSDHNPYIIDSNGVGVVRARDITHDPAHGCDAHEIAEKIRRKYAAGDPRRRYVISNGRIASASSSPPWSWRAYGGPNAHVKHSHVSVSESPSGYDYRGPWGLAGEGGFLAGLSEKEQERIFKVIDGLGETFGTPEELGRAMQFIAGAKREYEARHPDQGPGALGSQFASDIKTLLAQTKPE